jgi:cation transport ATPase
MITSDGCIWSFDYWWNAFLSSFLSAGDGINDSTALAAAHVGLAMGANGSAMAVTAAGVVLMNENLLMVPAAIKLCRYAKNAMIENCVFAICIKIVAIVLAILGNGLSSRHLIIFTGIIIIIIDMLFSTLYLCIVIVDLYVVWCILIWLLGYLEFWHAILIDLGTIFSFITSIISIIHTKTTQLSHYQPSSTASTMTQALSW